MKATIHRGSVEDVLPTLDAESFDAALCDPPYGLGFMGKAWDHGVPGAPIWEAVARTLRPGAHLLAFGGTRTFHRLTVGIEDAGFEIRDCLCWMYGSGFPKSLDLGRAVDAVDAVDARRERALQFTAWMRSTGITSTQINAATASFMGGHFLTDAEQPAVATPEMMDLLRPLLPTVPEEIEALVRERGVESENLKRRVVLSERVGADMLATRPVPLAAQGRAETGRRIIQETAPHTAAAATWNGYGTALKPAWEPCVLAMKPLDGTFAANALKHGVAGIAVDAGRIGTDALPAVERGVSRLGTFEGADGNVTPERVGRWPANVILDEEAARALDEQSGVSADGVAGTRTGSTSGEFLSTLPPRSTPWGGYGGEGGASRFFYTAKADRAERMGSKHPTLKPLDLCAYLARLLLPPPRADGRPRRIVVPFSGAGSEMIGCMRAGWDEVFGIEREAEYAADAERRIRADMGLLVEFVSETR